MNKEFDQKRLFSLKEIQKSAGLICGTLAVFAAFTLMPLAFVANVLTGVWQKVQGKLPADYMLLLLSVVLVIVGVVVTLAVISIVFWSRSKKGRADTAGLILSILSFILCAVIPSVGIVAVFLP